MKYLLLIALVAAIWWVWKKRAQRPAPRTPGGARDPERMVVCAHCGVHLPQSDSIAANGAHFCCEAHRLAANPPATHD
ncbi:MAG: hypothetical protein J0M01_02625 [Dechloromonas sp.]|jgi:uncharacterized protein|nr:hypothetical protein [Dechloromonas sp.]MBN8461702.1 hypothetical protein [Dechloromonas sp.]